MRKLDWDNLRPTQSADCLSDLQLHRIHTKEKIEAELEEHARACTDCQARLQSFQVEDEATRQNVWFSDLQEELLSKPSSLFHWFSSKRAAIVFSPAVAALLLVIGFYDSTMFKPTADDSGLRTKGTLNLEIIALQPDGSTRFVKPDEALHAEDVVSFRVTVPSTGYLSIVGVDHKQASKYFPLADDPAYVDKSGPWLPDVRVSLDDTLGTEQVFAVLCREPMSAEALLRQAERALKNAKSNVQAIGSLDSGCIEAKMGFRKVELK